LIFLLLHHYILIDNNFCKAYPRILINKGNWNNKSNSTISKEGTNIVTKFSGKYVIDEKEKAYGVPLDIKTYRKLITEPEELDGISAYNAAKASGDEAIPFELAVHEIEKLL
jgi:hypothetical protein